MVPSSYTAPRRTGRVRLTNFPTSQVTDRCVNARQVLEGSGVQKLCHIPHPGNWWLRLGRVVGAPPRQMLDSVWRGWVGPFSLFHDKSKQSWAQPYIGVGAPPKAVFYNVQQFTHPHIQKQWNWLAQLGAAPSELKQLSGPAYFFNGRFCVFTQVLPGLYVGSFRDAKNEAMLKDNGITHILAIHENARPLVKVSYAPVYDSRFRSGLQSFSDV